MALDMFLSSIDISFFALPLVFHCMGLFFGVGFFFYLLVLSLMASQCYIELKRLSTIPRRVSGSGRQYVGLMDLIEECCDSQLHEGGIHDKWMLYGYELYFKFVGVSTLVMLLACNQAFSSVVLHHVLTSFVVGRDEVMAF